MSKTTVLTNLLDHGAAVSIAISGPSTNGGLRSKFLTLPRQLRDLVYAAVLEDAVKSLKHPYFSLPVHSRYESFLQLFFVSRQVHVEARECLDGPCSSKITFYCMNLQELQRAYTKRDRFAALSEATFVLRASVTPARVGGGEELARIRATVAFIGHQPGIRASWDKHGRRSCLHYTFANSPKYPASNSQEINGEKP